MIRNRTISVMPRLLLLIYLVHSYAMTASATSGAPPKDRNESPYNFPPTSKKRQLADLVCKITVVIPDPGGGTSSHPVCSAIALGPHLVLTARHCLEDPSGGALSYTEIYATFSDTVAGSPDTYKLDHTPIDKGLAADDDFAVLHSEDDLHRPSYNVLADVSPPVADAGLFILHYPGNGPLVITELDCHAASQASDGKSPVDRIWLRHRCDTKPESSGGPIFDAETNQLVAIHQRGGKDEDDPASYNTALLLGEIRNKSRTVSDAMEQAMAGSGAERPWPEERITAEFHFPGGAKVVQKGNRWLWMGKDTAAASALVEYPRTSSGLLLFWDPQRDMYFRFPQAGGRIQSKAAEGEMEWADIGRADLIKH